MGTLAIAGLILSAMATAGATYMQYDASKTAAKQAKKNAEYNAKIARQKAIQERAARMQQERNERDALRRRRARLEGRYAAAGVLIEGTPTDWLTQQAAVDEFNVLQHTRTSETKAMSYEQRAALYIVQGKNQASAYNTQATAALVEGARQLGNSGAMWMNMAPMSSNTAGGGFSSMQAGNTMPMM